LEATAISPDFEISLGINNAPSKPTELRPKTFNPPPFERAFGETKEIGGFLLGEIDRLHYGLNLLSVVSNSVEGKAVE
jgi:hypothetical protein